MSFWSDFAISPLSLSLCFYERQSVKSAPLIGCPGSFEKKILSNLCRQSILKQFWAVFEKYNIKLNQLLTRSRHITSLLLAMCLSTPVCQTSAANWLLRLIWKEILSTLCRESIMKKFWAVFEKYNIKVSRVMYSSDLISPYHLFTSRYVCMYASLPIKRG